MIDLRELYQDLIVDHGRRPRNFAECAEANHVKEGFNPLCGDRIILYVCENKGVIEKVTFQGKGCAISTASASLMTEMLVGKTVAEAEKLFKDFQALVTNKELAGDRESLGKLAVLSGVSEFPARVKCATLAWHTLKAALRDDEKPVTTE